METVDGSGRAREGPPGDRRSRTLVEALLERGASRDACAVIHFGSDGLQGLSWGALLERVRALSEALVGRGICAGDRVAVFTPVRLDGCVADLAVMAARAVTVAIDGDSTVAALEAALRESGARVVFVDGDAAEATRPGRWSRLAQALERVHAVEQVVAFDLPSDSAVRRVSLGVLEARGRALLASRPQGLEERSAALAPYDPATVCSAGWTAGAARCVLTHGSCTARARALRQAGLMTRADVVLPSVSPASATAKIVQAAWLDQGFPLAFARSAATALDDAAMVGASVVALAPGILEDLLDRAVAHASGLPGVRGRAFRWGMGQFDRYATARADGRERETLAWRVARPLVFGRIRGPLRARLGGRVRGFLSGGAPVPERVSTFFELCGIPVLEGLGAAEPPAPVGTAELDDPRRVPVLE